MLLRQTLRSDLCITITVQGMNRTRCGISSWVVFFLFWVWSVRKDQSVKPGSNEFLFVFFSAGLTLISSFWQGLNSPTVRGVSLMEKVRAEVGIYSLTYEDLSLQNVLDSKGQLVLENLFWSIRRRLCLYARLSKKVQKGMMSRGVNEKYLFCYLGESTILIML